jgi:TolA-binding protein
LLESGRARVDVRHEPKTDWIIVAGPYTIRVTGTSFDVSFEMRTQMLEVAMRSGSVLVEGPGIASPVEVRGSQRFVQGARAPEAAGSAAPPPSDESAAPAPAVASAEPLPGRPTSSSVPVPSAVASVAVASFGAASWASLAGKGQYGAVLEQAEKMGIERALTTAAAPDLMALGNAARFGGKSDLSARAYQAVRARFGGAPEAANAAFFLGRMVEGQSPNMAIGWYERYAAEAPAGAWVAEAMGRRMVLLKKSGAHDAAIEAARQYMTRFPQGPYAGVAREMTTTP